MSKQLLGRILHEKLRTIVRAESKTVRAKLDKRTNYLSISPSAIELMINMHPILRRSGNSGELSRRLHEEIVKLSKPIINRAKHAIWVKKYGNTLIRFQSPEKNASNVALIRGFLRNLRLSVIKSGSPDLQRFMFGNLNKTSQRKQTQTPTKEDPRTRRHVQFGHTLGIASHPVHYLGDKDGEVLKKLISVTNLPHAKAVQISQLVNQVLDIDSALELQKEFSENKSKLIGIIELRANNESTGGSIAKLLEQMGKIIEEEILSLPGSKSYADMFFEGIQDKFFDRKMKPRRSRTKVKSKIKEKVGATKAKAIQPPRGSNVEAETSVDYISLQRQINAHLYDTLKHDVMAKGGATERLNYRSGRFAGSVEVTNIIPPAQGLRTHTINVKYMYNPYMVFAPGGRLYKPLRNPEVLAGQAIRKIIRDQAIQELGAVNVRVG